MKKLLLTVICLFISTPCFSKWGKIFEGETMIIYIDQESIIKGEDSSFYYQKVIYKDKFWDKLPGYPDSTLPGDLYGCSLNYIEINCKNFMYRKLQADNYEDSNCSRPIGESTKGDWKYPRPSTVLGQISRQICKK